MEVESLMIQLLRILAKGSENIGIDSQILKFNLMFLYFSLNVEKSYPNLSLTHLPSPMNSTSMP